jgi:hypothetical protein
MQELCELGQRQLMAMQYLAAQRTLEQAEHLAWEARDWDALGRLYLPLQEARRQQRQRCAEGIIQLDCVALNADQKLDARQIVALHPQGQLLVAGWQSLEAALRVRELASEHGLYLETFLAAAFPAADAAANGPIVVVVPLEDAALSPPNWPPHSIVLRTRDLPAGPHRGDWRICAWVADLWQRLHLPFLAAADALQDPLTKIEAYRQTLRVDNACELAHQKLAETVRGLTIRPHANRA